MLPDAELARSALDLRGTLLIETNGDIDAALKVACGIAVSMPSQFMDALDNLLATRRGRGRPTKGLMPRKLLARPQRLGAPTSHGLPVPTTVLIAHAEFLLRTNRAETKTAAATTVAKAFVSAGLLPREKEPQLIENIRRRIGRRVTQRALAAQRRFHAD